MMNSRRILLSSCLAAMAGLALSGCDAAPAGGATGAASSNEAPQTRPLTVERLAQARGFTLGNEMAARTVHVFFDAQCPHCGHLWKAAQPLARQAKFVWVPVAVLNRASLSQGATLLGAADPIATMNEHEVSLLARQGGISADRDAVSKHSSAIEANTALLREAGITSVPYIHHVRQDGSVVAQAGSMDTAALAALLGLTAP